MGDSAMETLIDQVDGPDYRRRQQDPGMTHEILILLGAVIVNNVVLTQFLGLCPLMGASRRLDTAIGLGMATVFVMVLASMATYLIDRVLLEPLSVGYLRTLIFIGVIAILVQASEQAMRLFSPRLFEALGIYLPLITTNCAVLGVALLNTRKQADLADTFFYSLGSALGFILILVLFSSLRERLELSDIPQAFKGASIGLITAGIAALAFSGFSGMIRP